MTTPIPPKRARVSPESKRRAAAAPLAVAVLRVSTSRQERSGLGLDAQREAVTAFAAQEGLTLVLVLEDACSGSVAPAKRDGMSKALAMLAAGEVGTLITAKVDRLSRKNADAYALMELGHRQGWCIRTADRTLDTCSPQGQMMAAVAMLFAELERQMISDRVKAANDQRRARGGRLGDKVRTADEVRQRVRSLRVDEGLTLQGVADRMNADGILSHTGRTWTMANVRRVLDSLRIDDAARLNSESDGES